jgi:hypothetical protein
MMNESKSAGRAMPARSRHTVREPLLDFVLDPTDRPRSYLDATRKLARGLKLVDHRSTEAGGTADIRQAKNLNGART